MSLSLVILGLVTLQRAGELILARRNTARLIAAGWTLATTVATGVARVLRRS